FWRSIRDFSINNLVFIDKPGVNLAMIRWYARALKGERARGNPPKMLYFSGYGGIYQPLWTR
ncbi:MAG: hypothetical protein BRC52_16765, partial [Cyanobacteria bacterium SW_5_48_44]